jgi:VIT1/CCC1 family predicted Fe2+/Mn2+ transporter
MGTIGKSTAVSTTSARVISSLAVIASTNRHCFFTAGFSFLLPAASPKPPLLVSSVGAAAAAAVVVVLLFCMLLWAPTVTMVNDRNGKDKKIFFKIFELHLNCRCWFECRPNYI